LSVFSQLDQTQFFFLANDHLQSIRIDLSLKAMKSIHEETMRDPSSLPTRRFQRVNPDHRLRVSPSRDALLALSRRSISPLADPSFQGRRHASGNRGETLESESTQFLCDILDSALRISYEISRELKEHEQSEEKQGQRRS
jgi:hypothetical protein